MWTFSDARATTLETASPMPEMPPAPEGVPAQLSEIWRAPSPATREPVVVGPTVATAGSGTVLGRDARTGTARWRYARDTKLCAVSSAWSKVLVVHRNGDWCSDVTQLAPETGERTAQRNANVRPGTRLITDCAYSTLFSGTTEKGSAPEMGCSYVTATGQRLLNTWRSDLVRTVEYGNVPALIQPNKQPRTMCTYGTVVSAASRIGVIERCPGDRQDRLTVYDAAPEDWDDPEVTFSVVLDRSPAKVVAMTSEAVAVALPEAQRLVLYNMDGTKQASYPLDVPGSALRGKEPGGVVATSHGTNGVYWYTGTSTVALSVPELTPRWTLEGSLGAGTMFAGQYVIPIEGGLAVLDQRTGEILRTVAVDRGSYSGHVSLEATGSVLVEQRGDTVVALR